MPKCAKTCPKLLEQYKLSATKKETEPLKKNNLIDLEPNINCKNAETQSIEVSSNISDDKSETILSETGLRINVLNKNQITREDCNLNKDPDLEDFSYHSLSWILSMIQKNKFIRKTVASFLFFTAGIKLCLELDGWKVPN